MTVSRPLETVRAGLLSPGDGFRLPGTEPGQVFKFKGYRIAGEPGGDHVSAYGGDKGPDARRQWRAFRTDVVVADARKAVYPEARKEEDAGIPNTRKPAVKSQSNRRRGK